MFSFSGDGQSGAVEAFSGRVNLAGLQLDLERVEVIATPPSITMQMSRENWSAPRFSSIVGARAVFLPEAEELLIATDDTTMVVTGARRLPF